MQVQGKTKVYGIIGSPVAHSLSPLFQNYFAQQQNKNAVYVPFNVPQKRLTTAFVGLQSLGVQGINITVPHKETLMRYVEADEDASIIGAVNTVRFKDGQVLAINTDWLGIQEALVGMGVQVKNKNVLLFGAGGTARAMLHALVRMEADKIYICNRNTERLEAFISHAEIMYEDMVFEAVQWEQKSVSPATQDVEVLVNTTSIGLKGEGFPFSFQGKGYAFDVVYQADGLTPFCMQAKEDGYVVMDGLPMLIAQGAASFAWWHTTDMPDKLAALRWVEEKIGRNPVSLPGWGATV